MRITALYQVLKTTISEWSDDKVPRLGAALAYYSIFSIAPLLIIVIGVAGLLFGRDAAEKNIVSEIEGTVGHPVAVAIQQMLQNNDQPAANTGAALIGIAVLLFGAAGVFGQLQDALNTVWKVTPKPDRGWWNMIRDRFLSLTMVFGTGFLLLVSLVISAILAALGNALSGTWPGAAAFWWIVNAVVSFAVITFLFALIYRYVPDAIVAWDDVAIGAVLTAVLFVLGKFLLGWYLGLASTTSAYGAAGSLVVILLWVYYASQILLFGAEFTRVYASQLGSGFQPAPNAVSVSPAALARQGMPQAAQKQQPAS